MGNIVEYSSKEDKITPSELGSQAYEQLGRHEGSAFSFIGQSLGSGIKGIGNAYERIKGQQEVAGLSKDSTEALAALSQSWNKTASQSDPSATDTAELWQKHVLEPALEKLGADVSTDAGLQLRQQAIDHIRGHFYELTTGDQARMAGIGVKQSMVQSVNNISQAAYQDPTFMEAGMKLMDGLFEANLKEHALTGDNAAQLREWYSAEGRKTIALSAARGMAERNPEQFQKDLAGGKFSDYFSGEDASAMNKYAEGQAKLALETAKSADTWQHEQNKRAFNAATATISAAVIQPDGSLQLPKDFFKAVSDAGHMPDAETGTIHSMLAFGKTINEDRAKGVFTNTDPATYEDFRQRMTLPTDDPHALNAQQLLQARADRKLSDDDFKFFKGAVETLARDPVKKSAEKQFAQFLANTRPAFIPKGGMFSMTQGNPADNQRWNTFQHDAHASFEQAYANGTWQQVLDPHNAQFLGHFAAQQITNKKGANGFNALPTTMQYKGKTWKLKAGTDRSKQDNWVAQ